ncbi:glycosyltransferase [Altericista sp. CCNU0014]|uniref:glycosyltransferase n=1 Tax=Altericista sp. CCNU0014 TaxID=3082949 RepID=UPI00385077CD
MRIAYLTGEYPRATDTFIQREVAGLRNLGVEVHTFSVRPTGIEHIVGPEQQAERDRTVTLLPPHLPHLLRAHISLLFSSPRRYAQGLKLAWVGRSPGLKALLYQFFYFIEAGTLAHALQQRQIRHLHNHLADSSCTVAMIAATLAGIRFSFTIHGPAIFFEPYRWRLDLKVEQALFVSCISYYCRSQLMLFCPSDQWPKLHIVHCGVDLQRFTPVSHQPGRKRLLYTGRLSAAKGLPILFQALQQVVPRHPELILTLVGDGPDRHALETLAANLKLTPHLKFVGYQSQDAVCQYLRDSDIFVLPSFSEGLPVALMEALAAGVPVITTAIAGISELVEAGINGYLIPPGAVEPLVQSLDRLLDDAELRQRMGQAGRLKVEREFNLAQEVPWLKQVMEAALSGQTETLRP